MPVWTWVFLGIGVTLVVYAAFVVGLLLVGRREDARTWVRFVPDCALLLSRLLRDPRVPRRHKLLLVALVGYLALPFDLVPDFVPVAGALDDAIIVAFVLQLVLRAGEADLLREHWPGPQSSLRLMLRLASA